MAAIAQNGEEDQVALRDKHDGGVEVKVHASPVPRRWGVRQPGSDSVVSLPLLFAELL
jgi:hypothetical protein